MRSDITGTSRIRVALLSLTGIIAGHYATFWMMAPDGHARDELLALTGHGTWTLPAYLATALVIAGLFTLVGGRFHSRRMQGALALAAIQILGFAGLEVAERSLAHGLDPAVLNDAALWLGIGLQLAIALIAPILYRVVERSVRRLLTYLRPPASRSFRSRLVPPAHAADPIQLLLRNVRWLRGPPAALLH